MSKTGDIVTIKMTDDPDSSDFEYMAHRRGDTQKDVFYIGAYLGSVISNKLRSLSGKTIVVSNTYDTFETWATNNGAPTGNGTSGYNLFGWYQALYIQCMFVLKFKNLNSQAVIGNGYANVHISTLNPGGTETKGMEWGVTNDTEQHVKCFGIEDLWGNVWQPLNGFVYSSSKYILTATENFNNTGSGYIDRGQYTATVGNPTKILGTVHAGFWGTTAGGSTTTYYCDATYLREGIVPKYGGCHDWGANSGIFANVMTSGQSEGNSGGRLMYL